MVDNRGKNPQSQANLKKGPIAKSKGAIATRLTLKPQSRLIAQAIGRGNMSQGVDDMGEIIAEAKLAIQCLLKGHLAGKELGERVLVKLEELEIDQLYKEVGSDLFKPKDGAYII